MNASSAVDPQGDSIQLKARLTGLVYLLTVLTGIYAEGFVAGRLVVADPAGTARNILAHEGLFRSAFAVYLVEMTANVAMTVLFYEILRPAGPALSRLALAFGLVGCTIKTMSRLFFYAPLLVLNDAAFDGAQQEALASLLLRLNGHAAGMALVFFGFFALIKGWLILRSTFLPRFLGVLALLGGIGWLTFLAPPFALRVFPLVAIVGLGGALATIVWLLVKGVDVAKWKEQDRALAG